MTAATANGAAKRAPRSKAAPKPAPPRVPVRELPPVGIARFKEVTHLLEQLMQEKTDVFLQAISHYQDRKREVTTRPLNHVEAAQVAAALADQMGEDPIEFAANVQQSELRTSDPASPPEFLLAAGLSTAPEFLDAAMNVVALMEMAPDDFRDARKDGTLRSRVSKAAEEILDDDPPLQEMRERAQAAFAHFATAGGEDPGKAVGLVRSLIGQALKTAMEQAQVDPSGPSPLTVSQPPTGGDSTS